MQDEIPMTIDGAAPEPVRRRLSRGRGLALVGAGAVVLTLGGGAVALAAGQNGGSVSTVAYSYGAPSSGSTARPTPPTPKPHLDGKVKSVAGTSILITDRDGFTRTIVTSGTTKYSNGLTASPAVGTEIHAEGKVDANGTSLDATTVGKAPTPPAGGPGGHGPGGPGFGPGGSGGPGIGHGPGKAPSGTGTAPKPSATPSKTA